MDKYTEEYMLRNEGINGVKIISRDLIPTEIARKVKGERLKSPEDSKLDRRYDWRNGTKKPIKDYMISGEGRPPLVIREVASEIEGMKKYALIDMQDIYENKPKGNIRKTFGSLVGGLAGKKDDEPYIDVGYAYSEGIDIEKMIKDSAYASTVISLFQEDRLNELRGQEDSCYIGTVKETAEGYSKMIRPNPQAVMNAIREQIYQQEEMQKAKQEENSKKRVATAQLKADREEAMILAERLTEEQAEILMEMYFRRVGTDEYLKIQRRIADRATTGKKLLDELIDPKKYTPDALEEGLEQ